MFRSLPPLVTANANAPHTAAETVLCAVRRSTLAGRLYPTPPDSARREALEQLASENAIRFVPASVTSLGGWWGGLVSAQDEDARR